MKKRISRKSQSKSITKPKSKSKKSTITQKSQKGRSDWTGRTIKKQNITKTKATKRAGKAMDKNLTAKRERQYQHILESETKRGLDQETAKRIAAATVNKQRSLAGETKEQQKGGRRQLS